MVKHFPNIKKFLWKEKLVSLILYFGGFKLTSKIFFNAYKWVGLMLIMKMGLDERGDAHPDLETNSGPLILEASIPTVALSASEIQGVWKVWGNNSCIDSLV